MQDSQDKKRVLTKIRKPTLSKQVEEEEDRLSDTDPHTQLKEDEKILMLNPCLGLVEQDRKICIGTQYLNPFFRVTSLLVDNHGGSKAVTLNLEANENAVNFSWETTVEKLESYGDAELAAWAYRIRKHSANYPHLMAKYFDMVHSKDPQVLASFRRAKARANLACKEIEKKYAFRKLQTYSTKDSTQVLSISYSEKLLNEIGHNIDSFFEWAKENGLPMLFDRGCSAHLEIAKNFFEGATLNASPIEEKPEYMTNLFDKDGSKKPVVAQYITITEPSHNGFFSSGYFILKESSEVGTPISCLEKINCQLEAEGDLSPKKNEKDEAGTGVNPAQVPETKEKKEKMSEGDQ